MCASIGGIVDAQHNLARQQPLDAQVPLIKFSISCRARAQIVWILIAPVCKLSILPALRWGKSTREGVLERRRLRRKVVVRKKQVRRFAECGSRILEVRRRAHAEVDAGSTAYNCLRIKLVGKSQARSNILAVRRNCPVARSGELRGAQQFLGRRVTQTNRL